MRFCSIFSQLLQIFPRQHFQKAVQETKAERHARGFTCWDQFVAMLFCQLAQAQSLREVCLGLASYKGKLCHLGLKTSPARSTLAYANEHRAVQLYEQVFYQLLARCQQAVQHQGQGAKLRFKNKLVSIDASTIELCATVFDWAKFRRTKGAVKLHLVLQHQGYLPTFAVVTSGCQHEVTVARTLCFEAGTIVVVDRGYTDYQWFGELTRRGITFVTRLKDNAVYEVIEERTVPQSRPVLADQVIGLSSTQAVKKCPYRLRRVEVYDPRTQKVLVFLTNHLTFGATTIAAIYKQRWQIELFFKALKQNLKIKTFIGTSANALKIQVWTALIAMLLLRYLQLKSRFGWAFSHLVALLRLNLMTYCNLWQWLEHPYHHSTPT
jgi:hypothetical protein